MADLNLSISDPLEGLSLPFEASGVRLMQAPLREMYSVAPLKGAKLKLPDVGMVSAKGDVKTLWFGQGVWLVIGAMADDIAGAAVTDQSDGWVGLEIRGAGAADVMARLCPLDLDAMEVGQTARTELAHMMASVTVVEGGYDILLMRSFARSGTSEILKAMRHRRA